VKKGVDRLELRTERDNDNGSVCLWLSGIIDEQFDSARVLDSAAPAMVFDVSGVTRITAFGVRQWTEMMKRRPADVLHLYLLGCPPVFVDQLNMVLNFGGRAEVISAAAVYVCEACNHEQSVTLDLLGRRAELLGGVLPTVTCEQCGQPMRVADDPQQYVRLVNKFGAKSLDKSVIPLLSRNRLYEVRDERHPPETTKLVHGDITVFQITGVLDHRFRPRRLASGVEGDVVFDLGQVEGMDRDGATLWRELLEALSAATSITLVDVPEVLLPLIEDGTLPLRQAKVSSARLRAVCTADPQHVESMSWPLGMSSDTVVRCGLCGRLAALDRGSLERVNRLARRFSNEPLSPSVQQAIAARGELLSRARAEEGTAAATASAGDTLARYRVLKPLSEGGMAEIFLAVHQGMAGFQKLTVLKKIRRKMLERRQVAVTLFLNEARIAASLNHPNIVQTFEVGEHGGDLFIAMEYVHGVDVRQLLKAYVAQKRDVAPEYPLYVAAQITAALHHAHTARDLTGRPLNIVHRDVSPSNVLIGFDGHVKLLDFGVATALGEQMIDGVVGKFPYMSPEQAQGETLDGRSDIFSLGIVLYEMYAKKSLFGRGEDHLTLRAVIQDPIPPLTNFGVPDYIDEVVQKALVRNINERYQDARAFGVAVENCLRRLSANVGAQQLSALLKQMFPERSSTPPVDVEAARPGAVSGPGEVTQQSPSESYRLTKLFDGPKTIADPSMEELSMEILRGTSSPPSLPSTSPGPAPLRLEDRIYGWRFGSLFGKRKTLWLAFGALAILIIGVALAWWVH
jgi:serine/threonine protein kinase